MAWQWGRWSLADGTADLPDDWGILIAFSVSYGRSRTGLAYQGARASLTVEGGDAWVDFDHIDDDAPSSRSSDPLRRGDGVMIRWAADDAASPKGPPVIFAGRVVDVRIRWQPAGDGQLRRVVTVTALDHLAGAAGLPASVTTTPATAYRAIRDLATGGLDYPAVRLGPITDSGLSQTLDHYDGLTLSDLVTAVCEATGCEVWMRHGERLLPDPPPDIADPNLWSITPPEMVVRLADGTGTFSAPHILTHTSGDGQRVFSGAPIPRRYAVTRATSVELAAPTIYDEVELVSAHPDDYTASASPDWRPRVPRGSLRRRGCIDAISGQAHPTLDAAAARFARANTQKSRVVSVAISGLDPAEVSYWAPVGVGDEVLLPAVFGLSALVSASAGQPYAGIVRRLGWQARAGSAGLTLELSHVPLQLERLNTGMTVGYDNLASFGYSILAFGALAEDEFTALDGTAIRVNAVHYQAPFDALTLYLQTVAMADAVEDMYLLLGGVGYAMTDAYRTIDQRGYRWQYQPQTWQIGDSVPVVITADVPDTVADPGAPPPAVPLGDREIWAGEMIVGGDPPAAPTVYGFRRLMYGYIPDRLFAHGGRSDIRMDRLTYYPGGGGNNFKIAFQDADDAAAAEGLYVAVGDVEHLLDPAERTGDEFAWHEAADAAWTVQGARVPVRILTAPPQAYWSATMTVGHFAGWDGWAHGQYGALDDRTLRYADTDITMFSVRFHDTTNTMRVAASSNAENLALDGLWLRVGNVIRRLVAGVGDPDSYGWSWVQPHTPNWTGTGTTVTVELWETDPTGL